MRIFVGSDHRGFDLKEKIKTWLSNNKLPFQDIGAFELDPNDDYPVYAEKLAESVAEDREAGRDTKGILICGSGVGVDIVANKFDGIRSGLGINSDQVKAARNDDDINILAIAADYTDESGAIAMVEVFLNTEFGGEERRERRLNKIEEIEDEQ